MTNLPLVFQGQKGSKSKGSHHPDLSNLLLKTPQSALKGLPLVVSLKADGADPLRNWRRMKEVMRLYSEPQGRGTAPKKRQQGRKCPGSGDGSRSLASSVSLMEGDGMKVTRKWEMKSHLSR